MLNSVSTRCETWSINVPTALAPKPLFTIGQFVPLHDHLQPTPGVTYYGLISGFCFERWSDAATEWWYWVELPDYHPDGEFNDWQVMYSENDLKELLESL